MARQLPWHHEDGVDADVVTVAGKAGCKALRSNRNAAEAIFVEGQGRGLGAAALLHFHEGNDLSAPCHQVDFSTRNPRTPCEDSPAAQSQPPCGNGFRAPPASFRDMTVQALPAKSNALA